MNCSQNENRKKVLITGASGFIGKALVNRWSASGTHVKACLRHHPPENLRPSFVEFVSIPQINRSTDWLEHLRDVNWVVHLAGRAHLTGSTANGFTKEYEEINCNVTKALMRSCQRAGVERFVFISSVKVHGEGRSHAYQEEDPFVPLDPYARSKRNAELAIQTMALDGDTEWVILRPPLVYGPGVKANFLALMKLVDLRLPLPLGALDNRRSLIYIENIVDAIVHCAANPNAADQVFLVSDDRDLTVTELIQEIAWAMGRPPMVFSFPPRGLERCGCILGRGKAVQKLTRSLTVDISKIKKLTGWQPPIRVRKGIAKTVDWFNNEVF